MFGFDLNLIAQREAATAFPGAKTANMAATEFASRGGRIETETDSLGKIRIHVSMPAGQASGWIRLDEPPEGDAPEGGEAPAPALTETDITWGPREAAATCYTAAQIEAAAQALGLTVVCSDSRPADNGNTGEAGPLTFYARSKKYGETGHYITGLSEAALALAPATLTGNFTMRLIMTKEAAEARAEAMRSEGLLNGVSVCKRPGRVDKYKRGYYVEGYEGEAVYENARYAM